MELLRRLVLYTALGLGANAALADTAALEALREGQMKKLMFAAEPAAVPDVAFEAEDGGKARLSDYRGKHVLVNFWATWCAPCRKEMPSLQALQQEFGGEDFEVVTIATGRNTADGVAKFFADIGVDNLPRHMDPSSELARSMAVLGLPISVLLNPEGQEIARLRGDAEWDTDSARAIVAALIAPQG